MAKKRSKGQTATALSLSEKLKDAIDARAAELGLSRSAYLCALARADIAAGGPLTIRGPLSSEQPGPESAPARIVDTVLREQVAAAHRRQRKPTP